MQVQSLKFSKNLTKTYLPYDIDAVKQLIDAINEDLLNLAKEEYAPSINHTFITNDTGISYDEKQYNWFIERLDCALKEKEKNKEYQNSVKAIKDYSGRKALLFQTLWVTNLDTGKSRVICCLISHIQSNKQIKWFVKFGENLAEKNSGEILWTDDHVTNELIIFLSEDNPEKEALKEFILANAF